LTWVDNLLPSYLQPYARLARIDKPIGTWLLLWPCFWSTALANAAAPGTLPDPSLLALFGVGAFAMRGAGCTVNDLWDRDVDRKVSRTASRPLASGDVSVPGAVAFLAAQLSAGLAVLLSLPHTWYCFQFGAASLPLVGIYPAMKRFFPYPQLVLGLTFNWGAWMGWAAVHGSMDYSIIGPLYGSGVTWTLVYDTIYAHQDKRDDEKLGLQSTALTFGKSESTQKALLYSLATATWLQWLWVGHQADLAFFVYSLGATSSFGHLLWQIRTADFDDPHNLAARFRSNSTVGLLMFTSLTAGTYFA
jgi:4-hydroxybenzoate polyprenyltransferase